MLVIFVDEFPEAVGVARISEALQAHMWPVMTLKVRGQYQSPKLSLHLLRLGPSYC